MPAADIPFVPNGLPVGFADLVRLATANEPDAESAIRTANPQLRRYLRAKPYDRSDRTQRNSL